MFSLSLRERILVTAILSAVTLGVAVKHWRDAHREAAAILPPANAVVVSNGLPPSPGAGGLRAPLLP